MRASPERARPPPLLLRAPGGVIECRAGFAGRDTAAARATDATRSRTGLDPRHGRGSLYAMDAAFGGAVVAAAFAAGGADAVQLHAVAADGEAEEAADAVLQVLELLAGKLDDLAAALADDVIVLARLGLDRLEARLAVVEVALRREADLLQQLERPVDGGVADARAHLAHGAVELVDRDVLLGREEDTRDVVALRGRLETPSAQRLLELPHARTHRHRVRSQLAAPRRRSINRRSAGER